MAHRTTDMSEHPSSSEKDALTLSWIEGLAGNAQAYESALGTLSRILRGYLRSRLPLVKGLSEDLTEDLVQDVLIALHTKRHTYRSDCPVLPWAYAITKHRLIDYLRMMKVRPKTLSLFDEETGWDGIEGKISLQYEEEKRDRESDESTKQDLLDLIENLSPQQKEVLRMAKLENRPLQEIADALHLSLANVKVTVHRAVKKLQAIQQDFEHQKRKSNEDE